MKTGVYGGTFNPIHNGHLHIVEEFRRGLGLDRVLLIPAHVPPHKTAPDFGPCRGPAGNVPAGGAEQSSISGVRPGDHAARPSYTSDTLEFLSGGKSRSQILHF